MVIANDGRFFYQGVQRLARSLAAINPTPAEKFEILFSLRPKPNSSGVFRLDQRGQDIVTAIGIYFLSSGYQHEAKIIPYLLDVLRGLVKCLWLDDKKLHDTDKIPVPERFSFCLNTLLSDIARLRPERRNDIFQEQISFLSVTLNLITNLKDSAVPKGSTAKETLCKATLPILIGAARAIGRKSSKEDETLFLKLFPTPPPPPLSDMSQNSQKSEHDSDIPSRTGSLARKNQIFGSLRRGIVASQSAVMTYSSTGDVQIKTVANDKITVSPTFAKLAKSTNGELDETRYFFGRFGSCFSQLQRMNQAPEFEFEPGQFAFSVTQLQTILTLAKNVLDKDLLVKLDEVASEVFASHANTGCVYKSFTEILTLVMVSLLRELLQYHTTLPTAFTKEVQDFVKTVFLTGQTELHQKRDSHIDGSVNSAKLNVLTNAACLDLLVWAAMDETNADALINRLTEKIISCHGHKLVVAHLPLILSCLDGIAILSRKLPTMADVCVNSLQSFLIDPSPILVKLHKQQEVEGRGKALSITVTNEDSIQSFKSTHFTSIRNYRDLFDSLRKRAIVNLCVALQAGLQDSPQCVQAFVASLSNKLYQDKIEQESTLVTSNIIFVLGQIAVRLSHTPKTSEYVLQSFQQRFCRPPSVLDTVIVEQLGQMVLTRNRDQHIYENVMKMFTTITIQSSSAYLSGTT
ncbi:Phosphatidylinositol 4-kinase alpha [Halotydeus destructor]|nr:Phosphatidylinositol 4-kinase alpha [Halotydeus destructor]